MLAGTELLKYTEANDSLTQAQLARGAGFIRVTKKGREQVLVKKFTDALLAAKGVNLRVGRSPGKSAKFETKVHKSGVVLVGRVYAERFGLVPGNELEIILDDDCIRLVPKPLVCPAPTDEVEEAEDE